MGVAVTDAQIEHLIIVWHTRTCEVYGAGATSRGKCHKCTQIRLAFAVCNGYFLANCECATFDKYLDGIGGVYRLTAGDWLRACEPHLGRYQSYVKWMGFRKYPTFLYSFSLFVIYSPSTTYSVVLFLHWSLAFHAFHSEFPKRFSTLPSSPYQHSALSYKLRFLKVLSVLLLECVNEFWLVV